MNKIKFFFCSLEHLWRFDHTIQSNSWWDPGCRVLHHTHGRWTPSSRVAHTTGARPSQQGVPCSLLHRLGVTARLKLPARETCSGRAVGFSTGISRKACAIPYSFLLISPLKPFILRCSQGQSEHLSCFSQSWAAGFSECTSVLFTHIHVSL